MSAADVVLSYHDVLVRRDDLRTLDNCAWLNDVVISFYFDFLERERCRNNAGRIVFCGPELTQLLKLVDVEDYAAILDGRIGEQTDFVFFSLNNCDNREKAGGAHWSLLVYSRVEAAYYHLDSGGSYNREIARRFSEKMGKFLAKSTNAKFVELSCPQQQNSYDCGIFVLCFAEAILENLENGGKIGECNLSPVKTETGTKRQKIVKLIGELSRRGESL